MEKESICKICGKQFIFCDKTRKGIYCSVSCRYADHGEIIKKSYSPELKKLRSEMAILQMEDQEQREVRRKALQGTKWTKERKEEYSFAKTKDIFKKAKKIIISERGKFCERCGLELEKIVVHHKNGQKWKNDPENLMILCKSCHSKIHNEWGKVSNKFAGKAKIANYIANILINLGIDINLPDFQETPLRVARMYEELFEGVGKEKEIKNILSTHFPTDNNQMVIVKKINIFSLCPHHLTPVHYKISIGYIPRKRALGLSKLVRVAELLAKKPILQENLTQSIVDNLMFYLQPDGAMAVVEGVHYCMVMRGVKSINSVTVTSAISGTFKNDHETRNEFLSLIK